MTTIDPEFLKKFLRCPESKAELVQSGEWLYSTDPNTRRKYPVRDGLPVMLIEESQVADPEEFSRVVSSKD